MTHYSIYNLQKITRIQWTHQDHVRECDVSATKIWQKNSKNMKVNGTFKIIADGEARLLNKKSTAPLLTLVRRNDQIP